MRDEITPLILTFDEKENITRSLHALSWAKQIVLIDSFSTDGTTDVAKSFSNVRVLQREFDSHTSQWNFGLDQVSTPWVLSLDADYELSPAVIQEILELVPADEVSGYSGKFEFRIFGHSLRASVYPPRVVLFRRDRGRYQTDGHTQLLKIAGDVRELRGPIYHDDRKPLSRWLRSQDHYMKIEAPHLLTIPNRDLKLQDRLRKRIFFTPPIMMLYLAFGRGLILNGWPGWYYIMQRTLAEILLSLRLITEKHKLEGD